MPTLIQYTRTNPVHLCTGLQASIYAGLREIQYARTLSR